MGQPIIRLTEINKSFDDHHILKHINLSIENGEFLAILGPSGCGKTTLLRMLSGFETPDQGSILINQQDVTRIPPEHRHVNMVFQSYALFPHMTVFENVAFGLQCQKLPTDVIEKKVHEVLARVKLFELKDRKPEQLSGGQQQRVAMARAIVNEPLVLLLDEPLSALDYHLRRTMRIELKELQRRLGITFIMVTHDQEEALTLADRVVVMNHGQIEQIGAPRDVYEEPNNLFVAQFIGETNVFKTTILNSNEHVLQINIAGTTLSLQNKKRLKAGQKLNIVVRPEDIEVWGVKEIDLSFNMIPGIVREVIYKGSTVDLIVELANGQQISATEFFDEDDEDLNYELNEPVLIQWTPGWEVILIDETS